MHTIQNAINGRKLTSSSRRMAPVYNPATGEQTASLPLSTVDEVNEGDIDCFGDELCLAAREEPAERAAGTARVGYDLTEPGAVDATLTDQGRGAPHHAGTGWRPPAISGWALRVLLRSHVHSLGHRDDDRHRFC